jgi:membrane-anchored protein YejM (alkaline phosphatase superfamily)
MIAMIDDAVGRVLGRLAALGLADDTIVIFTADHGDFLGDHRLLLKGPAHYEGITHVPFIWAEARARTGRRTDVLAGTLDIAATILDRARVQPYNGIQGLSLLTALEGAASLARDAMVIEDDQQRVVFGLPSGSWLRIVLRERGSGFDEAPSETGAKCLRGPDPLQWQSFREALTALRQIARRGA